MCNEPMGEAVLDHALVEALAGMAVASAGSDGPQAQFIAKCMMAGIQLATAAQYLGIKVWVLDE